MRALFVFSGLLFYFSAFSQNAIRFAYDALGNRVKQEIVLQNSDVAKRNLSSEEKKRIISIPTCSLKNRSVSGPTQRKDT